MFCATMAAAIDGARTLARMDELSRSIWQAHGSGAVTDDEAQALAESLSARRGAIRGTLMPVGIPVGRGTLFPVKRPQRAGDRSESRSRRRRLAASGPMPPTLAARFTTGQLAVLRIVADEIAMRGVCGLCVDAIAARAGVCARWVQKALRLAEGDGLLVVQERRHQGRKNDPSLIRILSHEWRQWIRRGRRHAAEPHRVNSSSPHGYRCSSPTPSSPAEPSKKLPTGSGRPRHRDQPGIGETGRGSRAMR